MCLNCGCGQINERHGNDANIIAADLARAGQANGQDLETTITNMRASFGQLSGGFQRGTGWVTGAPEVTPGEAARPVSGGTEFASGAAGRPAGAEASTEPTPAPRR